MSQIKPNKHQKTSTSHRESHPPGWVCSWSSNVVFTMIRASLYLRTTSPLHTSALYLSKSRESPAEDWAPQSLTGPLAGSPLRSWWSWLMTIWQNFITLWNQSFMPWSQSTPTHRKSILLFAFKESFENSPHCFVSTPVATSGLHCVVGLIRPAKKNNSGVEGQGPSARLYSVSCSVSCLY